MEKNYEALGRCWEAKEKIEFLDAQRLSLIRSLAEETSKPLNAEANGQFPIRLNINQAEMLFEWIKHTQEQIEEAIKEANKHSASAGKEDIPFPSLHTH